MTGFANTSITDGINTRGQVVGGSDTASGEAHATLWTLATTPREQIAALLEEIKALLEEIRDLIAKGTLDPADGQRLGTALTAATEYLNTGQPEAASRELSAFTDQVQALEQAGRLDAATGEDWRAMPEEMPKPVDSAL